MVFGNICTLLLLCAILPSMQCLKKSLLKREFNIAIVSKNNMVRKARTPDRSGGGSEDPWWGWGDGWGGGWAGGWGEGVKDNNNNNNNQDTQDWEVQQGDFPANFPTNYYPWYVYQFLNNNLDNAASAISILPTSPTRVVPKLTTSSTRVSPMTFVSFVSTTPSRLLVSLSTAAITMNGNTPQTFPSLPTIRPPILTTSMAPLTTPSSDTIKFGD